MPIAILFEGGVERSSRADTSQREVVFDPTVCYPRTPAISEEISDFFAGGEIAGQGGRDFFIAPHKLVKWLRGCSR